MMNMKSEVVCKHRVEIGENIFCNKHKTFIDKHFAYKCSKGQCKDCEFPTLAVITINIGRCDECPYCDTERTMGAGYAFDYFCKASKKKKKIVGYVEYDSEIPPVPAWCPFYIK